MVAWSCRKIRDSCRDAKSISLNIVFQQMDYNYRFLHLMKFTMKLQLFVIFVQKTVFFDKMRYFNPANVIPWAKTLRLVLRNKSCTVSFDRNQFEGVCSLLWHFLNHHGAHTGKHFDTCYVCIIRCILLATKYTFLALEMCLYICLCSYLGTALVDVLFCWSVIERS